MDDLRFMRRRKLVLFRRDLVNTLWIYTASGTMKTKLWSDDPSDES